VQPIGPCEQGGLYAIGEAPGWDEERKGEPFVGKTGKEVRQGYFPLAGIRVVQVRINNSIRCLPKTPQNKLKRDKPDHIKLMEVCSRHHLIPELELLKPRLIIAMGVFACLALGLDINLELQHGIPIQSRYGMVFPMFHPSGGIHEPKKMLHIRKDWYRLRKYLRGELALPYDQYAGLEDYQEIEDSEQIYEELENRYMLPLACDTENTRKNDPFCLTYTTMAGRGRLIRAGRRDLLDTFQNCLDGWEGPILWHNWLHDNKVTDKMRLVFPRHLIVDTMLRCFHLGNIPQGLKALAFRELGMDMEDFDDVVTPYSRPKVIEFFADGVNCDWPKPPTYQQRAADGSLKTVQPHSVKSLLKLFFTHLSKDPNKDPFIMWDKNWKEHHRTIEQVIGREYPGKCITHAAEADWPRVLRYACRDADALIRFYEVLRAMERRVRKFPQEQWEEFAA
jgi:uracil-DNA glycosylase family 4